MILNNIFLNTYTKFALLIATIGGLVSDYFDSGYLIVFALVIAIISYATLNEHKKQKLYQKPNLPIPLIFNISNPTNSKTTLNTLFKILDKEYPEHEKNLKKYLNITQNDLIFEYSGDIFDEKRFIDFLKITKHNIKKLQTKTPQNVHFHIVYIGPIANAILIGTMLGTEGVTLYQYNKSSDSYTISLKIDTREYKEHIKELKILKKELIGKLGDHVTVAIDLASHKLALNKLKKPIIHLQSTIGATINDPKDFIRANQEIYAILNELQQKTSHITLSYSMPTTIAILLGMSIQNYWDIELTQFSDGEYKTVIKHLHDIKYHF